MIEGRQARIAELASRVSTFDAVDQPQRNFGRHQNNYAIWHNSNPTPHGSPYVDGRGNPILYGAPRGAPYLFRDSLSSRGEEDGFTPAKPAI